LRSLHADADCRRVANITTVADVDIKIAGDIMPSVTTEPDVVATDRITA